MKCKSPNALLRYINVSCCCTLSKGHDTSEADSLYERARDQAANLTATFLRYFGYRGNATVLLKNTTLKIKFTGSLVFIYKAATG